MAHDRRREQAAAHSKAAEHVHQQNNERRMSSIDTDWLINYLESRDKLLLKELAEVKNMVMEMADVEGNRLLSTAEAAKEANVSVNTIKNWCYDGSLEFEKPGGKLLIRKKDLLTRIKKYTT
jgi:excisionase family DNA binding protein